MKATCPRCKREFLNAHALSIHTGHLWRAKSRARRDRLCPDNRTAEEARAADLAKLRLKTVLGLLGRHP